MKKIKNVGIYEKLTSSTFQIFTTFETLKNVRQNTADDDDNPEENVSSTKKNAMERSFYGRDSCDEKTIEKKHTKNNNSLAALLRLIGRTSPYPNSVPNNEEAPMHDASTTSNGVVSTAVPHVPDVKTITRFSKCSIN